MPWKDTTSYSRDDKERIPTCFSKTPGPTIGMITVTSGHIYYPGKWVMHCSKLGILAKLLNAQTKKDAQNEALAIVRKIVTDMFSELQPCPTCGSIGNPACSTVGCPDFPEEEGPGEEDGPWAEGWEERSGLPS